MVDGKEIAEYTLQALRKAGADQAQCKVGIGSATELNIDAGEFSLMRTLFNNSVTMKVIKNNRKGTISINKTDKKSIDEASELCVQNALASQEDDCLSISSLDKNEDFTFGIKEPDPDKFFNRIKEYMEDIKNDYPQVLVEQLIADFSYGRSFFANTNGVRFTNSGGYYSLSSMYSSHDGDKTTSFNSTGVDFVDLDKKIIDLGMQRLNYDLSVRELNAVQYDKGNFTGNVIFMPSSVPDIVGTAIDSFTSDGSLIDGTSPWKDKLKTKVASDILNVNLVPLDKRVVGGERYTPEGYKTKNSEIIKNGILESFTLSEYAARKTGNKRCGTLSGCMEIKPGNISLDDMIKSIDRGLLIGRLSGGEPAGNGDFSAVAKNSFLIENGKVTVPVTETMISGNLDSMMKNVINISKETVEDGTDIMPWIEFGGVTVS